MTKVYQICILCKEVWVEVGIEVGINFCPRCTAILKQKKERMGKSKKEESMPAANGENGNP